MGEKFIFNTSKQPKSVQEETDVKYYILHTSNDTKLKVVINKECQSQTFYMYIV